jgi:hypothetical protein
MQFEKVRGNNHCTIFGTLEGFDANKSDEHLDNTGFWEPWEFVNNFYEAVCLLFV